MLLGQPENSQYFWLVRASENGVLSPVEQQSGALWQRSKRGALFLAAEQQEGEKEANPTWQDM